MAKIYLNVKNLPCPLPLVKLKKCLSHCQKQDSILMEATDKGVLKDVPAFCQQKELAYQIVSSEPPYQIRIEVASL